MTRKVSVSAYYWIDYWSRNQAEIFDLTAKTGFDGIEVSLYAQPDIDPKALRTAADSAGLEILVSTGVPSDADPSSPDPAVRADAVAYLGDCLQTVADMGSSLLGGLTYSPWMLFPHDPQPALARERVVQTLREVAPVAERLNVTLCLEPVNRFETYVLNTAEQGSAMIDAIDSASVALQLDTFHLNIEERDAPAAIRSTGSRLGHFQVADNDRSVPGKGSIDFAAIGRALDSADYQGWVGLETFPHPGTEVGSDTFTWRRLVGEHEQDARDALTLIRDLLGGPADG